MHTDHIIFYIIAFFVSIAYIVIFRKRKRVGTESLFLLLGSVALYTFANMSSLMSATPKSELNGSTPYPPTKHEKIEIIARPKIEDKVDDAVERSREENASAKEKFNSL